MWGCLYADVCRVKERQSHRQSKTVGPQLSNGVHQQLGLRQRRVHPGVLKWPSVGEEEARGPWSVYRDRAPLRRLSPLVLSAPGGGHWLRSYTLLSDLIKAVAVERRSRWCDLRVGR